MTFIYLILFILIILSIMSLSFFYFRHKWRNELFYRKISRRNYGFIYFYRGKWELTNLLLVKIGRTNNIEKRISASKTSNPFGIWLLGVIRVQNDVYAETLIHRKFQKWRISKKNEWFFYPAIMFYMWCVIDRKLTKHYKERI